jgi:peroxiredoxin
MLQWRRLIFLVIATAGGIVLVAALLFTLPRLNAPPATPTLLVPVYFAPTATPTPDPTETGPIAATVNDDPISLAEWNQAAALDRAMNTLAQQPPTNAEATLDRLINERLVLKAAQAQQPPLTASEAQAETRLASLEKTWNIDNAKLDSALTSTGITRAQFVAEIQRLLIIETYLKQVAATQDVSQWLATQRSQAHISLYVDLAATVAEAPSSSPTALAQAEAPAPTATAPAPTVAAPASGPVGVNEGELAPDFTLNTPDGKAVRLSELRGRPVVVNLWATWCPICRSELAALQAAYVRYKERGVELLGVDVREDAATLSPFAAQNGLTYPLLLDSDGAVADQYQVRGIPTTLFIDSQGVIRKRHLGPLTEDQFAGFVDPLLPPPPTLTPNVPATLTPTTSLTTAPGFDLMRENGSRVRLGDYLGKETVVLVFFRGQT